MYLENSEQCSPATVEEERPAIAVLTEQYRILSKNVLEDLSNPTKTSRNPIKEDFDDQIVCDGEIKTTICPSDSFSTDEEETESSCCDWNFESFEQLSTAGDGLCESYQIVDQFETLGLSQPFDERAQHCESFDPCKSPEDCANHSLTSECGPCCEHCAELLDSSQQCEPSNQQCDPRPEEEATWCGTFGGCEIPHFIHECSEELEALQHEPLDQQDEIRDRELEDCEESERTSTVSDSEDWSYCNTELCEDDQMPYQSKCSDDKVSNLPEEHETFEEESGTISPTHSDNPDDFYLDESQDVSIALESGEVYQENYQLADTSSDHDEESETQSEIQPGYETAERTSDFFSEEDGSSDCSSVESKSFKTCPSSIPSDPCSDSSEESDKGAQEDSGDEQMQWESFEEDEDLHQSDTQRQNQDRKKTPIIDIIIEDYFDLFDRHDYYGCDFTPKRHYVSCFDGGDIHARLYLEECKEINQDSCLHDASDQAGEDTTDDHVKRLREETLSESVSEFEKQPSDWIIDPESSSAENDVESDEAQKDVCVFCSCDLESCDHKTEEPGHPGGHRETMCPPFVNDISVEGDAYEDEGSELGYELLCRNSSTFCGSLPTFPVSKSKSTGDSEDYDFRVCSEMEPYWSLSSHGSIGLSMDLYVEEYYAYQIRSIETLIKQALGGFMNKDRSCHQICEGKADDSILSLDDSESQLDRQQRRRQGQNSLELNTDCESREATEEKKTPPSGIIYCVVSEQEGEAPEQIQEEEESDDESCDCEYCFPSVQQVCSYWFFNVNAQQV